MTVASEITRLQGAKADIKTAIEGKGVAVPSNAKIDTYDEYINQIQTGGTEIHFSGGTNYNWNGNMETWWDGDCYRLTDVTQGPRAYGNVIRFENDTYYVFGGFMSIAGANKSTCRALFIAPFEYFKINKSTNEISLHRGGVNSINTSASNTNAHRWNHSQCLLLPNTWREYADEYRTYFFSNNVTQISSERNGNIACYFYIKKDLSAMGYVKADDARWGASRGTYGEVQTSQADEQSGYPSDFPSLFSNYNTGYIGDYSGNLAYNGKIYTPCGYEFDQNSGNRGYGYAKMFTVTDAS